MDMEWEDFPRREPPPPRRGAPREGPVRRGAPPGARRPRPPRRPREPRGPRRPSNETGARIAIAIPLVVLAVVLINVGGWVFAVGMAALASVCLWELFGMTARARPLIPAGVIAASALILVARTEDPFFHMALVAVAAFPVLFAFAAARPDRRNVTYGMAVTVFGVAWIAIPFAHAVLLRDLEPHGGALIVDVLVGTFVGDTAAYFGGRAFGSRRIAPSISPGKTLEGLLCGIVGGAAAVWFAGLYQDWMTGAEALALGVGVAAIAPLGDLFESLVKRDLGMKDSSDLLGAHGGLLDRLDAVLFTIVAGYYISAAFGGFVG